MSNNQSQYILDKVELTADRLSNGEVTIYDLSGSVAELNIFENIELPYLTGTIAIVDDVGFRSFIGIKGSEKLLITLRASKAAPVINKEFMVTGLATNISVNERTDVHILTLIESHAYLSSVTKISESFTGEPEQIIKNILKSHLSKDTVFYAMKAAQSRMRVNIPYWNPLAAVDWIRDRMSAANGSPFFTYAALRDNFVHIEDLDSLMSFDAWNSEHTYTYSQDGHSLQSVNDPEMLLFHVKNYSATQIESTLRLAQAGAIGSDFLVRDLTSGSNLADTFHNSNDTINNFIKSITEGAGNSTIGFDTDLQIGSELRGNKNIGSYTSKVFSSVVASRQHYEQDNKTAISGYHDELSQSQLYKLKIKSAALRAILRNNVFEITIPGTPYLVNKEIGVGSNLNLRYVKPSQHPVARTQADKDRSGKFMIYKVRHSFTEGIHNAHMEIVKLADEELA